IERGARRLLGKKNKIGGLPRRVQLVPVIEHRVRSEGRTHVSSSNRVKILLPEDVVVSRIGGRRESRICNRDGTPGLNGAGDLDVVPVIPVTPDERLGVFF